MRWLFRAASRLNQLGILGMNRRNAAYILDHNPRARFPVVDDKLRMRDLCLEIGVPTPEIYATIAFHSMLRNLPALLGMHEDFVIKPNRGSAGRGVLVIAGRAVEKGDLAHFPLLQRPSTHCYLRHNGAALSIEELLQHLSDILSGMYSLAGRPDCALIQQRVRLHPCFAPVAYKGIPDVRVIVYRGRPVMAMLRLPTAASRGRANLHQGGIGVGVDLDTGRTTHAVQRNRVVHVHPDTGAVLVGLRVPHWKNVLEISRRVARAVGLGYLGVDVVVDEVHGPMLLEGNARPGLAIQIANNEGLLSRLGKIDDEIENRHPGK